MVYVDTLKKYEKEPAGYQGRRRVQVRWCHMIADSVDELHAMADRLGLKRAWFQDHPRHPHYDLIPTKRAAAIKMGAMALSRRAMATLLVARSLLRCGGH